MKTNATLRITRLQYRAFADQVKKFGCCLSLSTFRAMGNSWGIYNTMAQSVCADVSTSEIAFDERPMIQLATSVNTAHMRRQQRPEIDWSALHDDEIYPFIVAHEIGHRADNFDFWDLVRIGDDQVRSRCQKALYSANEVLADRYAWGQIRPGQPVPLCEHGKRIQETVAADLELLNKHAPRVRRGFMACPPGQYRHVPQSMLMTNELAAFVGPNVSPQAIGRVRDRARVYRRDTRSRTR